MLEWTIAGAVFVVGSIVVAYRFLTSDLRAKHALRKLERSSISDLAEGDLVKIVGTVCRTRDLLTSPSRKAACVYYHAWHEELQPGEKNGIGWVSVGDESHACAFAIDDGTGVAHVESDQVEGALSASSYEVIAGTQTERGREAIIEVGQRIAVIGRVTREPVAEGYRDGAPRHVLRDNGAAGVIVSDDPSVIGG